MPRAPFASVVIPAVDEEACVATAVRSVREDAEVIVVDGGSRDGTCAVAASAGARVVTAPCSRGLQLDAGARAASGEWLIFLHADTWLETGWAAALAALAPHACAGAFRFAVDSPRRRYRAVEAGVRFRCRWFQLPYGDQGLFVRRSLYDRLGGFAPIPLMEDVEFVRRLARCGGLALLEPRAFTHPRRWERGGLVATTLRNWWLLGLYAAGCPAERLARIYGRAPIAPSEGEERGSRNTAEHDLRWMERQDVDLRSCRSVSAGEPGPGGGR